jgi:cyclophilin family peptidyl-prolyl cis-trans isomerase
MAWRPSLAKGMNLKPFGSGSGPVFSVMPQLFPRRLRRFAGALVSPFRSSPTSRSRRTWQRLAVEQLEDRRVMTAPTLGELPDVTMGAAAPWQITLDGFDADGDPLTYTVSISNSTVQGFEHELRQGELLEIAVEHAASSQPGDVAISGAMVFKLFEDLAPRTTARIKELAEAGFYDDVIFHRILDEFVIQGGDPTGTGSGGSDLGDFDDEYHPDLLHTHTGLLSMAKSTDDSNDSQFFITEFDQRHLDFNHSIFGMLVEGENIREAISNVPANGQGQPASPVTMTSVQVVPDTQNGVLTIKAPAGATGTVTVTVTAMDPSGESVQRSFVVTVQEDINVDSAPFLDDEANPDAIPLNHNQAGTFQLHANDIDDGPMTFVDRAALAAMQNQFGEAIRLPAQNPNLQVSVNPSTGQLTVTPTNGIFGVFEIIVGVRNDAVGVVRASVDTQILPVYIDPPPPGVPDLVVASDTGSSTSDNLTRLDNSAAAGALQFTVGNVVAGAEVRLFADDTLIGQATVPTGATSVSITTNGTFDLTDGQHTITAVQTLLDQDVDVGNLDTTVDLASNASQAVTLTVDTTPPTITSTAILEAQAGSTYTYNVASAEEGTTGFVYSLVDPPAGATIDATTGVISWIPSVAQGGDQDFKVRATDPAGNTVDQDFTVVVELADDELPVIDLITDKTIDAEDLLTFVVTATDADTPAEELVFSLAPGAPAGAAIDADSGVFTWTPTAAQASLSHTITVRVFDGSGTTEATFEVTVIPRPTTFQVVNGDLLIAGTAGNDQLTVTGTDEPGQYTVSGSLGSETVNGVIGGIQLNMGDGADQVTLNNIYAAGSIVIDLGEGDDVVRLGGDATVSSAQNLTINLGGGNDELAMQRVYIAGDQTIDGGAGNDMLVIAGFARDAQFWLGTSSAGATTVGGGDGDDSIQMSYAFVVGPLVVDGGNGNDAISLVASATSGAVMVTGMDGHDLLAIDTNYFVTTVVLNGGTGSDILLLKNSIVLQSATLSGADGSDAIEVNNAIARGLMINAGAGHDAVAIRASLLENLFADVGDGDDSLILHANRIFGRAEVEGGPGLSDRLSDEGNLMRGARKRRFEFFG